MHHSNEISAVTLDNIMAVFKRLNSRIIKCNKQFQDYVVRYQLSVHIYAEICSALTLYIRSSRFFVQRKQNRA